GRVAGEAAGATAPEPAGAAARQDHRDRGALADPPACRPDRDRGYRRSRPWALRQPPRLVCLGRPGDLLGPARGVCTPPDPGSPQGTLLPSSLRDRFPGFTAVWIPLVPTCLRAGGDRADARR